MSVTIHTNLGDLKCEVFCEDVPRTAENFLALCASDYYNSSSFHRNIKARAFQKITARAQITRAAPFRFVPIPATATSANCRRHSYRWLLIPSALYLIPDT